MGQRLDERIEVRDSLNILVGSGFFPRAYFYGSIKKSPFCFEKPKNSQQRDNYCAYNPDNDYQQGWI
jgi:hypothetical protein